MKKRKIKLSLRKQKISNFKNQSLYGGITGTGLTTVCCIEPASGGDSCDLRCASVLDRGGRCNSDSGCYGGPDETLTCPEASCDCPGGPVVIIGN